jgi:hypothetical protein
MNAGRGFKRLFLVLAICYYAIGGFLIYVDWDTDRSARRYELSKCIEDGKKYFDVNDNPITSEADCNRIHPPVNDWAETLSFLLFPAVLYGIWRILAWVGRGFRDNPKSPS